MTLYRQLLAMILAFFLLLFAGVFALEFTNTRDYLARQMASDVQNTLTSLGLSLLPHLENRDRVSVESVVNAVFDGGYYRQIRVQMPAQEGQSSAVVRTLDDRLQAVPDWFTRLPLFVPVRESQVLTSGWMQMGRLTVEGHPGYAYQQLWNQMVQVLGWLLVSFLCFTGLVVAGLRYLLQPLRQVEARARQIALQQFGSPLPAPRVPEIRGLIEAFNGMSTRLQSTFEQQAREAERLHREAFQDRVSGFGNRRFLNQQLQQWTAEPGTGALVLMEVHRLEAVYRREGFQGRNRYLRTLADRLREHTRTVPGAVLARPSLREFAAILPGEAARDPLEARLRALYRQANPGDAVHCSLGAVLRRERSTPSELLAQADLALQQAKRVLPEQVLVCQPLAGQAVLGREGWRQLVVEAMQHGGIELEQQPVFALEDHRLCHREILAGIRQAGVHYRAGQFLPYVEQFDLGGAFDRQVLEQLVERREPPSHPLAVNLSVSAIGDRAFVRWLCDWLASKPHWQERLLIELPEFALEAAALELERLCRQLKRLGVGIGFDGVGRSFETLDRLTALQPAYLKVDVASLGQGHGQSSGFLTALAPLALTRQIELIATRVETETLLARIQQWPVGAYQGFLNPPEPLSKALRE